MRIAIACDHAGLEMKREVIRHLEEGGYEVLDLGTNSTERTDYPIYARKLGEAITSGEAKLGIGICGTGIGMSICLNKIRGIRAACCSEPFSAAMSRAHNDANALCFGARVVGVELAEMIVDEWLRTSFLGGRHLQRVDLIKEMES